MNKANLDILVNIIGAVQSGGQIYGNRRYNAYTPPYTNTSKQYTITLGWAQNYGAEAKKLIQMIYDKDTPSFKQIDKKGLIQKRLSQDWVAIKWNPNSIEKDLLIKLIDSPAGHKCQDKLFTQLIIKFVADCEKDYTKDEKAQMMYCEIRHLGGKGPVDRIFKKCNKNYSLDNIMAQLKKDQQDTSNDNQVGDKKFWSRHQKCYEFINKYVIDSSPIIEDKKETETKKETTVAKYDVNKLIKIATDELGYLEKKSNSQLDNKTANAGSNNYTKYWRDLKPSFQGQPWCDAFVDWCFMKAYGAAAAQELECGGYGVYYTPDSADCYKAKKQWYTIPEVGDQIFFKNDTRICHTGIVIEVNQTQVITIEGNTSGTSTVVANGGGVRKKSYDLRYNKIAGYGRPDYKGIGIKADTTQGKSSSISTKQIQHMLNQLGWNLEEDNEYGPKTTAAVKEFQKKFGLEVDGKAGPKTINMLNKAIKDRTSELTYNTTGKYNETPKKRGKITDLLNIRKGPGKQYTNLVSYPTLPSGKEVDICDMIKANNGSTWYYILIDNSKHGFASADFIKII